MFTLPYGQHRFTKVEVCDELGPGDSYHEYMVSDVDDDTSSDAQYFRPWALIHFQKGPVVENGKNGCFMEDLLHIVQHRLECFQAGKFACPENAEALDHVVKALDALNRRTRDRQARGVEGTNKQ